MLATALVHEATDLGVTFRWNRVGHGVSVYDTRTGSEIDYMTVGDQAQSDASERDVLEAMAQYVADLDG